MTDAAYRVVEHDGGWAYKLGEVFSETFPSRQAAETAVTRVVQEQQVSGADEAISWEDERGVWHDEAARGDDRPHAYVAAAETASDAPPLQMPHSTQRDNMVRGAADSAFAAYDKGDQYTRSGLRVARAQVRSDPVIVMLLAVVCGFVLGMATATRG